MTTLFIDYNNIAMMKVFNKDVDIRTSNPNYKMWEFLVFETIYDYIRKFKATEVIIAKDNKYYWRKKFFNRYKEKRKEQKDKEVDWDMFMKNMTKLFSDLGKYFPFKCFDVKYCEGDDIIGVLASYINKNAVILSSDKDYKQLLNDKIKLYSPYTQQYITCNNPIKFIEQSSLTGQAKDGILNVITPEDWPSDLRKPGFGVKKYETWIKNGLNEMLNKTITYNKPQYKGTCLPKNRYKKNKILMDFQYIPDILKAEIKSLYDNYTISEIKSLYDFFDNKNWTRFLNEFELTENQILKLY